MIAAGKLFFRKGRSFILLYSYTAFIIFLSALSAECLAEHKAGIPSLSEYRQSMIERLTPEELRWIDEHQALRVGGPKAFPPFFFFDDNAEARGIGADYVILIMDALGIAIEYERNLPWPQVLDKAKRREIDLIAIAAKTDERNQYLNFSQAYLSFPLVIISRNDYAFIGGLDDLFDKNVACVKGNSTCEWLREDIGLFHAIEADTPLAALEMVTYGKVDAHIENLAAASYLIRKNGLDNLKIAAPTDYGNYELFFAVRKDWPVLVSILNKALTALTPQQQSTLLGNWLSIRYEHGIQKSDVFKWLGIVIAFLLVPVGVVLVWNRRLKREIEHRKRMELALGESETMFSAIFHHSPVAITLSSLESGQYLDMNDSLTTMTGYTRAETIGKTAEELGTWKQPELRKQFVEKVEREGTAQKMEFTFAHKEGTEHTALISGIKITLQNSPCLLLVSMDISELKQAEKDRQDAQNRYTALFQQSLDPIVVYTLDGLLIEANPAAQSILQRDAETVAQSHLSEFLDKDQLEEVLQEAQDIWNNKPHNEMREIKLIQNDQTECWLETSSSLVYKEGQPFAILGMGRVISERKRAEKEQKALISQLLDALENIKTLKGMLPICAKCKKIRDDSGYWDQIESYIEKHSDALFSHGICPDCAKDLYGNEPWFKNKQNK